MTDAAFPMIIGHFRHDSADIYRGHIRTLTIDLENVTIFPADDAYRMVISDGRMLFDVGKAWKLAEDEFSVLLVSPEAQIKAKLAPSAPGSPELLLLHRASLTP